MTGSAADRRVAASFLTAPAIFTAQPTMADRSPARRAVAASSTGSHRNPAAGSLAWSTPSTGLMDREAPSPTGGLTMDSAGNLYGTTSGGGNLACNNGNGCGTVFKLSRETGNNFIFSKVFQFSGGSGSFPNTGAIVDAAGNIYGSTFTGGNAKCNCGVVFALTP